MRHARPDALDRLEALLAELRTFEALVEKRRGVFYRGSKAFVHFHEGPTGLYADVRVGADFERFSVNSPEQRQALIGDVGRSLAPRVAK